MKTAIVYFSLEGNCKYVAEKINETLEADIIRLEPIKEYPKGKISKFIWGGKSVVLGQEPELKSYKFNGDIYDLIIIGTPIWAGSFAPPIKTFIKNNKLSKKNIGIYACHGGGSTEKCFSKLKEELSECRVIKTLSLRDPNIKKLASDEEEIKKFCKDLSK